MRRGSWWMVSGTNFGGRVKGRGLLSQIKQHIDAAGKIRHDDVR
jgi:hypothetical protein